MCILCIFEAFIEYIRMLDTLEMGEPYSEEEERALFEQLRSQDEEYITITHNDGKTERLKISELPN